MNSKILIYLPVIHSGYINFLKKYPNSEILILDQTMIDFIDKKFDYLRKEIRALQPKQAKQTLKALFPKRKISLLSANDFLKIAVNNTQYILPKEDIFIWLAEKYLPKQSAESKNKQPTSTNPHVKFDTTFLRWNRNNSIQKQEFKSVTTISKEKFMRKMAKFKISPIDLANIQKELSSDWWRQVGAVLFKNSKIIATSHNKHLPTPYTPYIDGNPRNCSHKGESIEVSTSIHAEAALISKAAKNGVSLDGVEMYVTTFPCPVCAKLIANSGISKLYFSNGYSVTDGEKVLQDAGVQIVRFN